MGSLTLIRLVGWSFFRECIMLVQSSLFTLPQWDRRGVIFPGNNVPPLSSLTGARCHLFCSLFTLPRASVRTTQWKKTASIFAFNFRQFLITYVQWKFDFQNIVDCGLIIFYNCILNSKSYWIFGIKVWIHWIKSLHTILVAESYIIQNEWCYTISKSRCKPH